MLGQDTGSGGWLSRLTNAIGEGVQSKTLQVAVWMGIGGGALTVGNLIFAAILDPEDFGTLSLLQAIISLSIGVGPLGFDHLAARRQVQPNWADFGWGALASAAVAITSTTIAGVAYSLPTATMALVFIGCVAGASAKTAAGYHQGLVQFHRAQIIQQSAFLIYLLGAGIYILLHWSGWLAAAAVLVAGYAVSGGAGLLLFAKQVRPYDDVEFVTTYLPRTQKWRHALVLVAIAGSTHLLLQLERLLIPEALNLSALGTFTVAWTIVGAPYKLLQAGLTYSVLPRLRVAENPKQRRRLIVDELKLAVILAVGGGILLILFSRPLIRFFYGAKYDIDLILVLALVLSGLIRTLYGLNEAAVLALGEANILTRYNVLSWLAAAAAVGCAFALDGLGMPGIVVGVAIGWLLRISVGYYLVHDSFQAQRHD